MAESKRSDTLGYRTFHKISKAVLLFYFFRFKVFKVFKDFKSVGTFKDLRRCVRLYLPMRASSREMKASMLNAVSLPP